MFKCSVKVDENLQKELNEKVWLGSLISLIVGSIGLGLYCIISVFIESKILDYLLWIMAFVFAFGLVFMINIKKINKKNAQNNYTDNLEIQEEFIIENIVKNEEIIATNKVYYKDLFKIRESENYIFLYINKMSAIPVPKKEFKTEELSKIKLWINSAKQINK